MPIQVLPPPETANAHDSMMRAYAHGLEIRKQKAEQEYLEQERKLHLKASAHDLKTKKLQQELAIQDAVRQQQDPSLQVPGLSEDATGIVGGTPAQSFGDFFKNQVQGIIAKKQAEAQGNQVTIPPELANEFGDSSIGGVPMEKGLAEKYVSGRSAIDRSNAANTVTLSTDIHGIGKKGDKIPKAQMELMGKILEANIKDGGKDDEAVVIPGIVNKDGSPVVATKRDLKRRAAQLAAETGGGANVLASAGARETGQTASRTTAAQTAMDLEASINQMLADPDVQKQLGPFEGRKVTAEELIGNPDPKVHELITALEGFALNNQSVHGMRSAETARQVVDKMLGPKFNAAALSAGLRGFNSAARSLVDNYGAKSGVKGKGGLQTLTAAEAKKLPSGTHFKGTDGHEYVVP